MKKILPYIALLGIIFGVLQIDRDPAQAQPSGGGAVAGAPKPIICTTACNVAALKVGGIAQISPTSPTTRTSTTTLTADANFQFTNLPIGVYAVSGNFIWVNAASGPGLNFMLADTNSNGQYVASVDCNAGAYTISASFNNTLTCANSIFDIVAFNGNLITNTSAETFSLNWSQAVSSAYVSTLPGAGWGAYMIIQRLK